MGAILTAFVGGLRLNYHIGKRKNWGCPFKGTPNYGSEVVGTGLSRSVLAIINKLFDHGRVGKR